MDAGSRRPDTTTVTTTTTTEMYYVAKQAERRFGVYYMVLGHSKLESMHRTRIEARRRASFLNQGYRLLLQEQATREEI